MWDPFDGTSLSLDGWKIKRENEINPLPYNQAAALPTAIRADNNLIVNGVAKPNTGTLLITTAPYRNSSFTEVKGVDLEAKRLVRVRENLERLGLSAELIAADGRDTEIGRASCRERV